MHIEKMITLVIAVALLGVGCNKGKGDADQNQQPAPLADAGAEKKQTPDAGTNVCSSAPKEWQCYQSAKGEFSTAYPPGWDSREVRSEQGEVTVFLHPSPIPKELPPEPIFAVSISAEQAALEKVLAQYKDTERLDPVTVGKGQQWERLRYFSDFLGRYDVVHLRSFNGTTLSVLADEVTASTGEFISILRYMEVQ